MEETMRRKLLFLIISLVMLIILGDRILTSATEKFSDHIKPEYISRTELFKKISLEYYGIADFAPELELVNRALIIKDIKTIDNFDLIIPCREAIERLKAKQTVSELGSARGAEKKMVAKQPIHNGEKYQSHIDKAQLKSSSTELLALMFAISIVLSMLIYFFKKSKKHLQQPFIVIDEEPIIEDDKILLDFDISTLEKKINKE